jgi:tRNA A-37 threonylcarbamoyl transferase component Bud32
MGKLLRTLGKWLWWPLVACSVTIGQQYPFVKIDLPNAPKGDGYMTAADSGGLWILGGEAGGEGLTYFDGSRFVAIAKDKFPNAVASGITEDTDRGLWVSTVIGVFHISQGQVERFLEGRALGIVRVAPNVFVANIKPAGMSRELIRISSSNGKWTQEVILAPFPEGMLAYTRSGELLFACEGGYCEVTGDDIINWRDKTSLRVTRYSEQVPEIRGELPDFIWKDKLGCVWFRTSGSVWYQCDSGRAPIKLDSTIASVGPCHLGELSNGSIVIPSFNKLAIGRPGNFRVVSAPHGYSGCSSVWVGPDDTIWITNFNGLYAFSPRGLMEYWTERDGLEGNPWSILPHNGTVFTTAGDGVRMLDRERSRWRQWLRFDNANRLETGPGGTLMVASRSLGVAQIASDGRVLRQSRPTEVWGLSRGSDGRLWGAGTDAFEVAFRGEELEIKTVLAGGPDGLFHVAKEDPAGGLWVCGTSGLLRRLASGWQSVSGTNPKGSSSCSQLAFRSASSAWYCGDDPVFSEVEALESGKPTYRNFDGGGANGPAQANFLASDSRGWIWRGTPDGVYVADSQQAKDSHWLRLDRTDGLPAVDTNQQSFREDADGSVWFSADNSIIHFAPPPDFLHPKYAPEVFLSTVSFNSGEPQMLATAKEFKNGSDITANLASLQMDRRNALHVRYRILPEQQNWTDSMKLDIHLGKLHWGAHKLQYQGALGDGPWSQPAEHAFTVLKPFWLTWPFLAGMAIAGVATGTAGNAWYKRYRERSQKLLPDLAEWRLAALAPEIQSLQDGLLDSRFEVGALLARGGFAAVVEGRDLEHDGRRCAIKIFRQEWADKEWLTKRFRHEVQALEQIHHPNVVSFFGHGTTPSGAPYLVMEFIEGSTLRHKLEAGRLAPQLTSRYVREIGNALREIHQRGICHRDLKPDNLMIRDQAADGNEIVLIDFSIAMVKDPDETLHGLSRAAGTLYYMAPEQGIGYADASTDIYSMAKVVIEMLTGKRLSDLLPDASIDLPQRVRELLAELPVRLSGPSIKQISRALEFHPLRRPADAYEFARTIADDLQRF